MKKILAIDDKLNNLITIKAVVKMLLPDYAVITSQSGEEGIELAKEHKPTVILLDIIMPGLDGFEVCKQLKEDAQTCNIPIVILTALETETQVKVKAFDLGADAFVLKPIDPVELAAQLRVVIRTKLAEDQLREEKLQLDRLVKERTKGLAESELKYRLLVENLQEPIIVIQNGIIKFTNPIISEFLGYTNEELTGTSFERFLHNDDKKIILENHKKRMAGLPTIDDLEFRLVSTSGEIMWFNFNVNVIRWQEENALLYILNNITEKIEIEWQKAQHLLRNEILLDIHKKSLDLDNNVLYEFVVEKSLAIVQSEIGFFYEYEKEQNSLRLISCYNTTANDCLLSPGDVFAISECKTWMDCIGQKKAIVCNNANSLTKNGLPQSSRGLNKYLNIPVLLNNQVSYIFEIGNKEQDYTSLDVDNIKTIANEISQILEKRKYEESIRESTEKYLAIHNNAPLPFQSLNKDGNIVEVNPAWLKVLGYNKEEVIGHWYGDFLHHDFVPTFKRSFPVLMSRGKVQDVPFKLKRKNGEYIDIKLDGSSGYTDSGDFKQTYCTFKNVTEEIKQQIRIKESEAKYRSFAEHFNGIVFRSFENYGFDFINGKVKQLTGFDEHDFITGKVQVSTLIHLDDKKRVADDIVSFANSAQESCSRTYRIKTKTNEVKWVTESITKFKEGDKSGVYGIIQDVTQIKQTNLLLEESNRFNQTLLDTIPFPMEIVNQQGKVLFMNPVLKQLFGKDTIGKTCWKLYRDDQTQCDDCPLKDEIKTGATYKTEAFGVLGGRSFDIIHRGMVFNGEPALLEIFTETTERKQFEDDIIAAKEKAQESDRLKSAFLANMSHEIRTPMNGILGFTSLLQDPGLTGEDQKRYVEIIKSSGHRMLDTVNDIIEISKIETGQIVVAKQKVNVCNYLNSLVEFFALEAKNKGVHLTLEDLICDQDAEIITDESKFSSVLSNLIKNAIKFTDQGFIKIGSERKGEELMFYVKDTGIGIPQNRIEAIFNRFEQADIDDKRVFEGSGLGLAISKSYVEMLGGKMKVNSSLGLGSTFSFTIPYVSANGKPAMASKNTAKNKGANAALTILVAEDDEISKLHLDILLKKRSSNIRFARTGAEAVEMCKENPEINLVLMDIRMPVMNGYEATQKIRAFNNSVIIIAQTAFVLEGDRAKALEAGCNDYISKPLDKDKLQSLIDKYF